MFCYVLSSFPSNLEFFLHFPFTYYIDANPRLSERSVDNSHNWNNNSCMCDIALELFIIDIQSFRAYKILKLIRYPSHRLHINPM